MIEPGFLDKAEFLFLVRRKGGSEDIARCGFLGYYSPTKQYDLDFVDIT